MLVDMPDTVHTIYDLIVAVSNRNGEKWKNSMLETICFEVLSLDLLYILKTKANIMTLTLFILIINLVK